MAPILTLTTFAIITYKILTGMLYNRSVLRTRCCSIVTRCMRAKIRDKFIRAAQFRNVSTPNFKGTPH